MAGSERDGTALAGIPHLRLMAILIKSAAEIEKMRVSGRALAEVHEAVRAVVRVGASTMDLERVAAAKMAALGAVSAFKGYHGYPAVLCTSVNDEVIHGIPSEKRVLREGDVVSVDCGVVVNGFYSDRAMSYGLGTPLPNIQKLLEVTEASLYAAIDKAQAGGGSATLPGRCKTCVRPRAMAW